MRAVSITAFGGPEVLQEVELDDPRPPPRQITIVSRPANRVSAGLVLTERSRVSCEGIACCGPAVGVDVEHRTQVSRRHLRNEPEQRGAFSRRGESTMDVNAAEVMLGAEHR